mmetsp:Transcript_17608/g.36996  ORF Transcript_17608/g.36996 Transcript_17608/m.36996 type:complete len:256 (-) Transcript_17608:211-978(-)|eukprot:CAMPEP_0171328040 /NCGR_PEP_ID=MMETSP0878-20121228/404_1 /TAXON_ID=67004 /ORGANISM="Thalassiosira weissflogii, Strain CCMP1336" /LENGTH=255 /DNA_ID=CAMNT_0011827859 /DNA_START=106 /DNA_END=873 /DNA_ORIENTATION=-
MKLLLSIVIALGSCKFIAAFSPVVQPNSRSQLGTCTYTTKLQATTETEAERLRRKARELLAEAKAAEDELHSTLVEKKKTRDEATDALISYLFPSNEADGVCALADRLRKKRLASDTLLQIVERLYEREVAARGLEHVEPSMHHEQVTFKRIAQPNEEELKKVQGLVDRLIEAAEDLDKEFIDQKSACSGKITHADIMHWGGGNVAKTMKEKAKDLGREHDEQFKKRLESFYEAAKRKHTKDEVDDWRDSDVWHP